MSAYSGPEINNDGLVFAYDMGNPQKSWRGAPTTNLVGSNFFNGNGNFPVNQNVTDIMPDGSIGIARELNAQIVVDPNRTVSIGSYSLTAGATYTLSFYAKNINCTGFSGNLFSPTLGRVIGGINYPALNTQTWTRVTTTFTVPNEGPNPVVLSPQVFRDAGIGFFRLTWLMLEAGSLATSYTPTSRSNTEAILDLVGGNTVTANSLTYNANGQFSFNGTNSRLECGVFNVPYLTLNTWVYKTSLSTNQGICRKNLSWAVSQYNGTLQVAPGTSWTFYNTGYTIPLNTWINICYVYSGTGTSTSQSVYINGIQIYNTSAGSGPISTNSSVARIGFDDNNWWWGGNISQTQIYNRALSASEIQQNFNALRGRFGL